MSRFADRMDERLHGAMASQGPLLLAVGAVVVLQLAAHAFGIASLLMGNLDAYRFAQVTGIVFSATLDIIVLLLVWMIFSTLRRVERESERVQVFMDNVYRKLLTR